MNPEKLWAHGEHNLSLETSEIDIDSELKNSTTCFSEYHLDLSDP
jgi:hypothetical protein